MIIFTDVQTYLALRPAIALAADLSAATGRPLAEELLLVVEAARAGTFSAADYEALGTIHRIHKAIFRRSEAA